MTDFEAAVLTDLKVLKTQMEQLLGNGQPGRLHDLEGRVAGAESGMQRLRGAGAAFGVVLTGLHIAITWIAGRHP
jgi:hypothetical protein